MDLLKNCDKEKNSKVLINPFKSLNSCFLVVITSVITFGVFALYLSANLLKSILIQLLQKNIICIELKLFLLIEPWNHLTLKLGVDSRTI